MTQPETLTETVRLNLWMTRLNKGLTQRDVEAMTDGEFLAPVISRYEQGRRSISLARLERLAEVYEVPVLDLLTTD